MPFITIDGIAQFVTELSSQILLANPNASVSTAMEAAQCVSRKVCNGSSSMHEANDEFNRIYSLSTSDAIKPLPNRSMEGFRVTNAMCKESE